MAGADRTPKPRAAGSMFDRLAARRLVVVSGKGGVGRTTIAALLGIALSDRGRKVLVATTGHDDRLAWMLGAERLAETPQRVGDRLFIQRLVPRVCVREYGALVLHSQRISSAVFDNRIVRQLLRAIPGLDDFAVLGKAWHEGIRGGVYDVVIFDGPATGHLVYSLGVPQAILETIPRGPLTREAELMQESFEDASRVQAVLVGLPETWPLTELGELGATVRERIRMGIEAIVVNGVWPDDLPNLQPPDRDVDPDDVVRPVFAQIDRMATIGRRHREAIAEWSTTQAAARCGADGLLVVPWRWEGIDDEAGLRGLLDAVTSRAGHGASE